jgi:protein-S-isoprenylcysteine O-methyltransferase Ste14
MKIIIWLSFAFGLSEILLLFVKRSPVKSSKSRDDRGSLLLLWATITIGFTGGFYLSGPISQFWAGFGSAFLISGLIMRWISILQLGKSFTVDVAITESAILKTDGIYKRVRHPSYTGLLLMVTGFSALMSSWYSFLILAIPVFFAIIYRIKVEENLLLSEFGDNYAKYILSTKKLIPGIY